MMNWRLVAIIASMIPVIVIAIQFDIQPEDILKIGAIPFVLAILAMMVKLGLQGIKFSYIVKHYLGSVDSIWKMSGVRIGSEFIKFTTPMFVGAEVVVIYWMHKKNIPPSKAMWIAILDIVTEVFAGGILAIIAGILALANGMYVIGIVILTTSIFVTSLWMILFFLSSKHVFQIPKIIQSLTIRFSKNKGKEYINQTNLWMKEICIMSRANLRRKESIKVFANGFALSLLSWIFYGITFMIIASGVGLLIEPFDSIMAVMGANAIGNLPITVGGSGLAEIGLVSYLNDLDPFNFDIPEVALEWNAVIGWRIATYYIPIAITWFLLVKLALSKYTKPTSRKDNNNGFN